MGSDEIFVKIATSKLVGTDNQYLVSYLATFPVYIDCIIHNLYIFCAISCG